MHRLRSLTRAFGLTGGGCTRLVVVRIKPDDRPADGKAD